MRSSSGPENPYRELPARLHLLGESRLQLGRRNVTRFRAGKSLTLLAFLALQPGIAHRREFLADLLWPDAPAETGRSRLSVALTFLRGLLEGADAPGSVFEAHPLTLRLLPGRVHTDVADFEHAVQEARREATRAGATAASRLQRVGDVLRAYPGELLPGIGDDWVENERARLAALQDEALVTWESLTQRRPPRPPAHPAHRADKATTVSTFPEGVATMGGSKAALPRRLTRLFGRDTEVRNLRQLAREGAHLVTLIGPGGVGKTQLSLESAAGESDRPVVWVPLADLTDAADIAPAVATALRLPPSDRNAARVSVVHALNAVPALVLLDNAEHLREGVADFVADLLDTVPEANIWVTSREALDVVGERLFPVTPLALPPPGTEDLAAVEISAACALFADRARMVRPDFAITDRNAGVVARLCRRLDGLPLALELAAARVQTTSLSQILQSLQGGVQGLSASTRRGLPDRHRSLYATIAWSVRLLAPEVARFFAALSVFHGGWTTGAAEVVTKDPLAADHLADLVTASLVVAEELPTGVLRYRMLETIRDFAASQLEGAARAEARERHLAYFLEYAEAAFDGVWECVSDVWPAALADEENFIVALETARTGDPLTYLRLAGAAGWVLAWHPDAGLYHLQQALSLSPSDDSLHRARTLYTLYSHYSGRHLFSQANDLLQEALSMARRLNAHRDVARYLNSFLDVEQVQVERVELFRAHGTPGEYAQALAMQAIGLWRRGHPIEAENQFAAAHELSQSLGSGAWALLLMEWGYFWFWRGDVGRAVSMLTADVEIVEKIDERACDHPRWLLAAALTVHGRHNEARDHADKVIRHWLHEPLTMKHVTPRRIAASASMGMGDLGGAEEYLNQAMAVVAQTSPQHGIISVAPLQAELALARGDRPGALAAASQAIAYSDLDAGFSNTRGGVFWDSITLVNARSILARTEAAMGLWDAARRGFTDTLRFRHHFGLYSGAFLEIEGLAACRQASGDTANAARLFAACETLRLRLGAPPLPHQARELADRVAPLRTDPTLQDAWRDGQNLTLQEAVALALEE